MCVRSLDETTEHVARQFSRATTNSMNLLIVELEKCSIRPGDKWKRPRARLTHTARSRPQELSGQQIYLRLLGNFPRDSATKPEVA